MTSSADLCVFNETLLEAGMHLKVIFKTLIFLDVQIRNWILCFCILVDQFVLDPELCTSLEALPCKGKNVASSLFSFSHFHLECFAVFCTCRIFILFIFCLGTIQTLSYNVCANCKTNCLMSLKHTCPIRVPCIPWTCLSLAFIPQWIAVKGSAPYIMFCL